MPRDRKGSSSRWHCHPLRMFSKLRLRSSKKFNEEGTSSSTPGKVEQKASASTGTQKKKAKLIEINDRDSILSVAFLDEKHILGGGPNGTIRCWQVEDTSGNLKEVGAPMDAGSDVYDIAVSQNGKWVVSGTFRGQVRVWNVQSRKKVTELTGHAGPVYAVDVSPDGSKIVTGSDYRTACIWSLPTGQSLHTLVHDGRCVCAAKFSSEGRLVATATWERESIRIYDAQDGYLLVDFKVKVSVLSNVSVAWSRDNTSLFALSCYGDIHYLDVSTGATLAKWRIHSNYHPQCIALAGNETYIAASANSSVSFWDTVTRRQIGSPIAHADTVRSMAVSEDHDLLTSADKTITLRNLHDIFPSRYCDNTEHSSTTRKKIDKTKKFIRDLQNKLANLKSRSEEQSHKLTSVRNQRRIAAQQDRDRTITALTTELEQRERSVAAKTDELAAVRKDLERLPDVSHELISVRGGLRIFRSQYFKIRQLYCEQITKLELAVENSQPKIAPVEDYVTDSDARAERTIIRNLEELNVVVQLSAMFIAAGLMEGFKSPTVEEQSSAAQRASTTIKRTLVLRLSGKSRNDMALVLPNLFQAYLACHLHRIISSWTLENGCDALVEGMYDRLRLSESQTSCGQWRSLTRTYIFPELASDPDGLITATVQGLVDIAVAAGCAVSVSAARSKISSRFRNRISLIISTAGELSKSIGDALAADFKLLAVQPAQVFDETTMEVDRARGTLRGQKVLCTTHLGLSKEVLTESPEKRNRLAVTTVIKSKVLLNASLG
ncbi:WD40-repeat-containing domain protein [Chiua virens]|nr:WD40-repeat-containing domain protein [Chiua virens]